MPYFDSAEGGQLPFRMIRSALTPKEQQWWRDAGYSRGERVAPPGKLADVMRVVLSRLASARMKGDASRVCAHNMRTLSQEEQDAGRGPDWHPVRECSKCGWVVVIRDTEEE